MGVGANVLCASGFEHFAGGVPHVLDHGAFVFAVGHVDFEDGDSVDVLDVRIELDEIVPARENFSKAGYVNACARLKQGFLVGCAKAWRTPIEFRGGFAFVAETTEEFLVRRRVRQIAKARNVDAERFFGTTQRRLYAERGKFAAAATAADVRRKVMAESAAGVAETVRVLRRRRIEQDARGFLRLRAEDHDTGKNLAGLASVAVDVENAASAVALGIHQDFESHGIRDERAIAGGKSVGYGRERGIEIRMRHTPALAGAAEMARPAAVDGLG